MGDHEGQAHASEASAQRGETERRPLGLVAGSGQLPLELARAARRRGQLVAAVAFPDTTEQGLAECVDSLTWVRPGEVGAILETFAAA
ncbi:MAG: hypothetical protein E4H11_06475, partial [Myxococcales bacterium]